MGAVHNRQAGTAEQPFEQHLQSGVRQTRPASVAIFIAGEVRFKIAAGQLSECRWTIASDRLVGMDHRSIRLKTIDSTQNDGAGVAWMGNNPNALIKLFRPIATRNGQYALIRPFTGKLCQTVWGNANVFL